MNFTQQQLQDVEFINTQIDLIQSNIDYINLIKDAGFDKIIISLKENIDKGNVYENNCIYLNQTIIPYNLHQELMVMLFDSLNEWKRRIAFLTDIANNNRYVITQIKEFYKEYAIAEPINDTFHFTQVYSAAYRFTFDEILNLLELIKQNNLTVELI